MADNWQQINNKTQTELVNLWTFTAAVSTLERTGKKP